MHRSSLLPSRSTSKVASLALFAGLAVAFASATACTMDPVGSAQEEGFAQTPDEGFQPNSEFHRPGQDCMACHGPRGTASPKFVVAGTVFWGRCLDPAGGPDKCARQTADRAEVRIVDRDGIQRCIRTNCAGNFFIEEGKWSRDSPQKRPAFPLLSSVRKVTQEGAAIEQIMAGHISRAGSCNDCHRQAPYWNSAGQVYLVRPLDQLPPSATTEYEACRANPPASVPEEDCEQAPPR
ncbi:MAG: hypothetical protein EOP08_00755 [Proteobacteria bacterium]|nr:MAG: hypothetical protein EOP08_00755 [Pseudomonadota bacterium]